MATPLSVDLFALRESLIRGDLRDDFEHSARRKVDLAEVPLEQADRHELEQMMYRTWYETALILTPADTETRIQSALQARYISLRARWQRYWTMHQARGGERACARSVQLVYDLVSDLKSTYLVSIAKALGNSTAMQLWRRCDQLTQKLNQHFKSAHLDLAELLARVREQATACRSSVGERCTAWTPLVLETYDQLQRLEAIVDSIAAFQNEFPTAGCLASALFALDNEALLRGIQQSIDWDGSNDTAAAQTLLLGYRGVLDLLVTHSPEMSGLFDDSWRQAA